MVTVLALLAIQLGTGNEDDRRVVAASPTTVDTAPATTSAVPTTTTTTSAPQPATATPTTTSITEAPASTIPDEPATAPTTTEPPRPQPCRNSYDPACGPTYWNPEPGPNQPLTVEVRHSPTQPQPGEEVTFYVTVTDPDARISRDCNFTVEFGDGNRAGDCSVTAGCVARYGPWTPPEAVPDRYETTFTHTYQGEGDFNSTFSFESSSGACYDDPYGNQGQGQTAVSVRTN